MIEIPKVIYQVWIQNKLPEYIKKNIMEKNPNYEYRFFSEENCINYLKHNYDKTLLDCFNNLKNLSHKCDIFRYALLYKEGGIYIDADLNLQIGCDEIIKQSDNSQMITSIGAHTKNYYNGECTNGFIFTVPNNPLFIDLICFIMNNPNPKDYGLYVKDLFNRLSPVSLFTPYKKYDIICYLFREVLLNRRYYIINKYQNIIVNTNAHNYLIWENMT